MFCPETKDKLQPALKPFYTYRDELSYVNGLIMKGERIMIPKSLRKNMLIKLHGSHMGIEKTRRLARETMFWPGINGEIDDYVANCSTCLEYRHSNQKEPLIPHTISELQE